MDMLFVRRREGLTGGHLKVRDYIEHTAASGLYRPLLHLSGEPDPGIAGADLFDGLACGRTGHLRPAEAYFLAGDDWRRLDEAGIALDDRPVVNLVQGFRHLEPGSFLRSCLARPAVRICVSSALADAVRHLANGPVHVAPTAIAPPLASAGTGEATDIFIGAVKDPVLGAAIAGRLGTALRIDIATGALPRDDYLGRMARARVAVLLPLPQEGFFLPLLEAMHIGAAVVTCDCLGARDHGRDGVDCLVAARTPSALADAARRLLSDAALRDALLAGGRATAAWRTIGRERVAYHDVLRSLASPHD